MTTPALASTGSPISAFLLVETLAQLGVSHFVIAPGSRSAPLTAALARRKDLTLRVLYDERSAGYVALGLAQQLGAPVGLVCTSGTAAVNFGPAVVEAFYQQIPLLVLTADRPSEWIDQQDNQAIRQNGLYGSHVRGAFTLPLDDGHPDTRWQIARTAADAFHLATALPNGPIQLNVPLREPLYTLPADVAAPRVARVLPTVPTLSESTWDELLAEWQAAPRKLIVGGQHPADAELAAALRSLQADPSVAVLGDITANIFPQASGLPRWDAALGSRDQSTLAALVPDLVLTFGGQIISKSLKSLLRARPVPLWRVAPGLPAPDSFQSLTRVLPIPAAPFFGELARRAPPSAGVSEYAAQWQSIERAASVALDDLLDTEPFGEFAAVRALLRHLPPGSNLQLGNSMPVRYAAFLGPVAGHAPAQINANRGASGIDGTVSTAVGAAAATGLPTTLIVGDLAFFYDRNGLWQRDLPAGLRIVLLNNHGGGIFDIIEGPDALDADLRSDYFLTPQPLSARRTAADHGLRYTHVTARAELDAALPAFFADEGPAILEIETSMAQNSATFRAFRTRMAGLRLG